MNEVRSRRPQPAAEDVEVARAFARAVRRRLGDNVLRLVLFGSRARGKAHPRSDHDFFVLLAQRDPNSMRTLYEEVTDFLIKDGLDISLKVS